MPTSASSSPRMVDVTVSSESYIQIRPEEMNLYRMGDPDQVLMGVSPIKLSVRDDKTGEVSIGAVAALSLTNGDVIKIMGKIEKLLLDDKDAVGHKLNDLFGEEKKRSKYSITPGTLRIFGSNRACFYTGRNWRNIRLNKTGN